MKLDLEADNVEQIEITVTQARDDVVDLVAAMTTELDNAQAKVFGGFDVAYIVIKIVKGETSNFSSVADRASQHP